MKKICSTIIFSIIILCFVIYSPAKVTAETIYEVKATNAQVNREVIGPVINTVDGVPAEPVDSFVWDGIGSVSVEGSVTLEVDPVANTGTIKAQWIDEFGVWEYFQSTFAPPSHPSGLRIGPSANSTELVTNDPITTNVYLHGDTSAGGPVLPTVFNVIATWGPAQVTLNGTPFNNPFDGPVPLWAGHTMTTIGVRGNDMTVRTITGDIYNPSLSSVGAVDNSDIEFHLVFHDAPGPMTTNIPPPFSFFYHLTFEDVKIEVKHTE